MALTMVAFVISYLLHLVVSHTATTLGIGVLDVEWQM